MCILIIITIISHLFIHVIYVLLCFFQIVVDIMDQKTQDDILESVESLNSWDKSLFVDHGGKNIDIYCSVGKHAKSPPDDPDQPNH